jgi:mono/diheme cytochrome c family protein
MQSARRQFWIIKHGVKASGMPGWGPAHDDQRIWAMAAFFTEAARTKFGAIPNTNVIG